jgi:hypothetical protein
VIACELPACVVKMLIRFYARNHTHFFFVVIYCCFRVTNGIEQVGVLSLVVFLDVMRK